MGRPTLLTPELQASICKEIEAGLTYEDAAELNGITRKTLSEWVAKGRAGADPYRAFGDAVIAARAKAKADAIKAVRAGVMMNQAPDWKAEAWFLERTFPDQYGPQTAVHVKVEKELDRLLDTLKAKLAPDVYDMVLSAIAGEVGGEETGGAEGGEDPSV
jgi:hypothetical protein